MRTACRRVKRTGLDLVRRRDSSGRVKNRYFSIRHNVYTRTRRRVTNARPVRVRCSNNGLRGARAKDASSDINHRPSDQMVYYFSFLPYLHENNNTHFTVVNPRSCFVFFFFVFASSVRTGGISINKTRRRIISLSLRLCAFRIIQLSRGYEVFAETRVSTVDTATDARKRDTDAMYTHKQHN